MTPCGLSVEEAAADATARFAVRVGDPWESAWAMYTGGFAKWYAGKNDAAVDAFSKAEEGLRSYGTSAWRYTLLCLARARMERGEIATGDRPRREIAADAELPDGTARYGLVAVVDGDVRERRAVRLRLSDRGASAVEFALILPVLVLLISGIATLTVPLLNGLWPVAGDPLAPLRDIAQQVAARGIKAVDGRVPSRLPANKKPSGIRTSTTSARPPAKAPRPGPSKGSSA